MSAEHSKYSNAQDGENDTLAVCQPVLFIITWLQVRHLYFSLLKLHLRPVFLRVVHLLTLIKNYVIGLCFSLLALI